MSRGSLQLRHRKACSAKGKDSRKCRCGPTVYAVLSGEWLKIGHLAEGWRKADLGEFEEQLAAMRRKRDLGEAYRPVEAKRLAEYAEEWFRELWDVAKAGEISKLTYNTYEADWRNHIEPEFGDKMLAAITSEMVRRYIRAKVAGGLSPRTANATITPLSAMLTDAREAGLVQSNPCQQPRRARHGASRRRALLAEVRKEAPKHLEPVEARALLAAVPPERRDLVLTALSTGFRRGEVLGLKWEDIDWGASRIRLERQIQWTKAGCEEVPPKCRSDRTVVLYSGLAAALQRRRQAEGYLFLSPSGRPWRDGEPDKAFLRGAYADAGLSRPGVLWHALRHTYASILMDGGIREDVVAGLMGHKRQGTTSIYTHLFEDAFDGVEAALDGVLGVNEASTNGRVTAGHDEHPDSDEMAANRMNSGVVAAEAVLHGSRW